MKSFTIFLVFLIWIYALYLLFTKFITKSVSQAPQDPTISSTDLLREQRIKVQQTREEQKKRMEDLKRKLRDQQQRY